MTREALISQFGPVAQRESLDEVIAVLERLGSDDDNGRRCAAAYGMACVARRLARKSSLHRESSNMLDALARAKEALDGAAGYAVSVVAITERILGAARAFSEAAAVAAVEWASTDELADVVTREGARCLVRDGER